MTFVSPACEMNAKYQDIYRLLAFIHSSISATLHCSDNYFIITSFHISTIAAKVLDLVTLKSLQPKFLMFFHSVIRGYDMQ